jgi:hypothetical protein
VIANGHARNKQRFCHLGPSVTSGTVALNAVHVLYFLPKEYKLVLPTALPEHKASYDKVVSLIERDDLGSRVQFTDMQVKAGRQAIIVTSSTDRRPGSIFGRTPEALASAVLHVARAAR